MTFQVEITATAERDVERILEWLSARSPQGALSWIDAWQEAVGFLAENALTASLAPESSDHQEEVRHWSFRTVRGGRYRALFILRGQVVYITNVRVSGQQIVSKQDLGKPNP